MRAAPLCVLALAVLATAGAFWVAPAARGDEPAPLPQGALRSNGYPPVVPEIEVEGDAALEAWVARMTAAAATSTDALRRGELFLGAAASVRGLPRGVQRSHDLLRRALADLPTHDPLAALARLQLFELALEEHAPPEARATGATAWAFTEWQAPVDASELVAARWQLAQREIHARYPPTLVQHALRDGNLVLACKWAHVMAERPDPRWREGPAGLWERAAILAYRIQMPDVARRDVELAAAQATDPEVEARLAFWHLHLDHGLLTPDGLLSPTTQAPKSDYLADLEVVLRGLADNPRVGPFLLSAASSALRRGDNAQALTLYRRALGDPLLSEAAWRQPAYWAGLLPAVTAALALERFDEAEELLATIQRLAGEPVPEADGLRAAIKLKRVQAAERASLPPPATAPPDAPDDAPPERGAEPRRSPAPGPGELRLPEAPPAPDPLERAAPGSQPPEPDAGTAPWGLVLASLGGLVLVLAFRRRGLGR